MKRNNNANINDKQKSSNIENLVVAISIIIILSIVVYIIYAITNSNKNLKINSIKDNLKKYDIEDKTNVDAPEVERVYEEIEIASYTTTLYDSESNRIYNINKACEVINYTIVKPDEEFSFNNIIGPMDESNGYKKATGFDSDGKLIKISGGGMCQISSTIYNAVLIANLEVVERHPHSRRVNYVPIDKDATIFYPTLDFKFKNNTKDNIKILCSTDNYSITVKLIKIEQST